MIEFKAKLEKIPEKGGWHFVRISDDACKELREIAGKNGNVPVVAKIGKTQWPSTLMSMGNQQWFIAVKLEVRKAESIKEGDELVMKLAPDIDRLP